MSGARELVEYRIRAGEDGRTEFKEVRLTKRGVTSPKPEDIAAELVAFANADGGSLFLGVADSGEIAGIPEDRLRDVQHWVADVATNNCEPPIRPTIQNERLADEKGDERCIVTVEVPRSVFAHRTAGGRYYTRVGATKRQLEPPELARLFQERGSGVVFDEQIVFGAGVEALKSSRLEAFFGRAPSVPWLDLLRNTRVVGPDREGADRPTVAGLLAFSSEPAEFLRFAFIEAARYSGTEMSSKFLVHEEKLDGRVPGQIDEGTAFVERFMIGEGHERSGTPPYDLDLVEEAIVNAVAHRDYSIHGSKIRLFLYGDRLEIYSPGKPPNGLTVEEMPYRTFTRNQLLVRFLSQIHSTRTGQVFIESRGEGVRAILERGEAHSGRRPKYELFGSELRLTIWARER